MFSDVVNLIFRDDSSHEVTSDSEEDLDTISQSNGKMKQREHILAKCLQFLKLLARYGSLYSHITYAWTYNPNILIGAI